MKSITEVVKEGGLTLVYYKKTGETIIIASLPKINAMAWYSGKDDVCRIQEFFSCPYRLAQDMKNEIVGDTVTNWEMLKDCEIIAIWDENFRECMSESVYSE